MRVWLCLEYPFKEIYAIKYKHRMRSPTSRCPMHMAYSINASVNELNGFLLPLVLSLSVLLLLFSAVFSLSLSISISLGIILCRFLSFPPIRFTSILKSFSLSLLLSVSLSRSLSSTVSMHLCVCK